MHFKPSVRVPYYSLLPLLLLPLAYWAIACQYDTCWRCVHNNGTLHKQWVAAMSSISFDKPLL